MFKNNESGFITAAGLALARVALVAAAAWLPVCHAADKATDAKAAAPATKAACLKCHENPKVKTADGGKSMTVLADEFGRSAHRKLDCAECHTTALTVNHTPDRLGLVKPEVCQDCHADEFKAIAGSIHGRRAKGDKAIKDCMGCHDSLHKVRKEGDPASTLSAVNQIKTCGGCHEEMMAHYERSEHARALLKSGLVGSSPSCSSCHGKHDILPGTEPASTTSHAKIPETCGKCHSGILREWEESAHGALWKTANGGKTSSEAPVCSTCHEPHAIKRPDTAAVRNEVSDRCGNCHAKLFESFHDSLHGKASELNNRKAAVCADCHTPHHNLTASDPRSSIHPDNLAKTCGASGCHARVNASFLTFDPHANPTDPKRNLFVYLVWVGMIALLLGVFGFFGLHDLLWLQRAVVGRLRGECDDRPPQERAVRAPLHEHADLAARVHRHQLPAAGGHRPAAEVRTGLVGAQDHGRLRRPRSRQACCTASRPS